MKLSKYFALTFVALAITACNNDDVTRDNGQGAPSGEKTWALFSLKIGNSTSSKADTPAGTGTETALAGEAIVATADIYIFKRGGTLETIIPVTTFTDHGTAGDGEKDAPTIPVEVNSGEKEIFVLLNKTAGATPTATIGSTTSVEFIAATTDIADQAAIKTVLGTFNGNAVTNLVMSGYSQSAVLEPNIARNEVENGTKNHISLFVNRAVAKIDVKLGEPAAANIPVQVRPGDASTNIGTLGNVKYMINNQSKKQYYFGQTADAEGVVPTPVYTRILDGTENSAYFNANYYNVIDSATSTPVPDVAVTTTLVPTYIAENTNKIPQIGNTTYVMLSGEFVPDDAKSVTGYTEANNSFTTAAPTYTAGQSVIYSYDYNMSFPSYDPATETSKMENNIKWLAGKYIGENRPAFIGLSLNDITVMNKSDYDAAVAGSTLANKDQVYAVTEASAPGEVQKTMVTVYRYRAGSSAATLDFQLRALSIGVYNAGSTTGLTCYYRVNMFDTDLTPKAPMYFSVIRNHSYHMTVQNVKSIGFSSILDPTVNPRSPLIETTTFMQVHMTINKWIGKDMNTDLGI